jgi:hypothetical protein
MVFYLKYSILCIFDNTLMGIHLYKYLYRVIPYTTSVFYYTSPAAARGTCTSRYRCVLEYTTIVHLAAAASAPPTAIIDEIKVQL